MVATKVNEFTSKMVELLQIEREAEMEETAAILSQYSFRVSSLEVCGPTHRRHNITGA